MAKNTTNQNNSGKVGKGNPPVHTRFKKGNAGNLNGRPKGKSKKTSLKKLIKDLSKLYDKFTEREKIIAYQLYEIAFTDLLIPESADSGINHLYFIESEIGIKIGKSKNVNIRLEQIRNYMPSCRILKVIQFAGSFEKKLHSKFAHINIKGNTEIGIEWFYKKQELLEFISEIDSVNDLARIFGSKELGQMMLFG